MDRVVVCFRWRGVTAGRDAPESAGDFSLAASTLLERRAEYGGRVVAWLSRAFAFDFSPRAMPEAITLLVSDPVAAAARAGFGVGIAEGELVVHYESGAQLALVSGAALERAAALATLAEPGDVLLDPGLALVQRGRLLTRGAQLGTVAGRRVRGVRLDLAYPWRRPSPPMRLAEPRLVGPELQTLQVQPGQLGVLVAPRGCGGTRALRELGAPASRRLSLTSWCVGEPLGSLREAFARARVEDHALPALEAATLEALLAGEGGELEATGALVAAWVGERGLIVLDDAADLDQDSLEAVAWAVRHAKARGIARVLELAQLPAALAELPRGGSLRLGALDPEEAIRLLESAIGGAVLEEVLVRWARRGGGRPLAIVEAARQGLESAELVREEGRLLARGRLGGRGGPQPARHWLSRRLRLLDEGPRAALDALLVLGGQARWDEVEALLAAVGQEVSGPAVRSVLVQSGWLVAGDDDQVVLGSGTLRDLLFDLLGAERCGPWQFTAYQLRGLAEGPLVAARATVHALFAGRHDLAAEQARRAAAAARTVGLESTAAAFDEFAGGGGHEGLLTRGLLGGAASMRLRRTPPQSSACARASLLAESAMGSDATNGDALSERAAEALRRGDLAAIAELSSELRKVNDQGSAAERLEVMTALRGGDVTSALRLARAVKANSRGGDAVERCRAALTYAVALGAAGRLTDALLEALEALARSREAKDLRGEHAVARFLDHLSGNAGQLEQARAWRELGASP